MARDHRRLAAIVSADVVGYSLLMGRDDSATLAGLKAHRRELFDPKIVEYGGRIVKTTGDGLLLEFPSVVDAVRCAVDVQRGMAERNSGVPPDKRIDFRIGINVGDIIIDEDDIFGDGVNVAARLEALADPGGICVSRVVRDQVLDKLSFTFEDLGAQQVKNIARPVEAYRVDLGNATASTPSRGRRHWQRLARARTSQLIAGGVVVLSLAGILVWTRPQFWRMAPAPSAPPLSVAVLPFTTPAGRAAEQQVADAFTRYLASGLGRSRRLQVASPSVAEPYKGKKKRCAALAVNSMCATWLPGEIRRVSQQFVIDARLIDADKQTQTWSARLKLEGDPSTQDQGNVTALLTRRLYEAILDADVARADKPPAEGASAMEVALYAQHVWARLLSVAGTEAAKKLFTRRCSSIPAWLRR